MPERNPAIVALNIKNQNFWQAQSAVLAAALENVPTLELAKDLIDSELLRGVPLYHQTTLHAALEFVQKSKQAALHAQAQKGGRAKKQDPLQTLIVEIVRTRPEISGPGLLNLLTHRCPIPPIEEIDGAIIRFTGSDGRLMEAQVSGLKDRLSRAKKFLNSR